MAAMIAMIAMVLMVATTGIYKCLRLDPRARRLQGARVGTSAGLLLPLAMLALLLGGAAGLAQAQATFTNPILPHGADPSVVLVGKTYYSVQSGCPHDGTTPVICMRAAATLSGLGGARPRVVWTAPAEGPNAQQVWAPQLDYLRGRWYLYYAADRQGTNQHRLFALVPQAPNEPLGPWVEADTGAPHGQLVTDWKSDWAIDPDVYQASDGNAYLLYSCRQDDTSQPPGNYQSICLGTMSDPLHLRADPRTSKKIVELSFPNQEWETRGFPTEEGPFGFTHDGVDYILFSGSFSGNPDQYSEGLLINRHPPQPEPGGNPLANPAAWVKQGPVFDGHHASYGTASSVLVRSPDGTELWNVYHGTDCLTDCVREDRKTWRDRSDRAQRAGWSPDGQLVMGYPVDVKDTDGAGANVALPLPSSAGGGTSVVPAWGAAFGDAAEGNAAAGLPVGNWQAGTGTALTSLGTDPRRFDRIFFGANPNWQEYVVYTKVRWLGTGTGDPHPKYGVYGAYVDRDNYYVAMVDVTSCGSPGCVATEAVVNGSSQGWQNCPLPAGFDPGAANALAIESVRGKFTVLLNGKALAGACQERLFVLSAGQPAAHGSNGQAGAVVENTRARYTGFSVSPGVPQATARAGETYALLNRASRLSLDSACHGPCAGKPSVVQSAATAPYPERTAPSQLWMLEDAGDRSFKIAAAGGGMCLDSTADQPGAQGGAAGAKPVRLQRCNGSPGQQWRFVPAEQPGGFSIRNAASGLALTGQVAGSAVVRLDQVADTATQIWDLIVR